jgi:hypothetical protein
MSQISRAYSRGGAGELASVGRRSRGRGDRGVMRGRVSLLCGRLVMVVIAAAAVVAIGAPVASASQNVGLVYTVDGLPAQGVVIVSYDSGVSVQSGALVHATSGSLTSVMYASNGLILIAGNDGASLMAHQFVVASGSTITGRATFPGGTSVTVTLDGHSTKINPGPFTIPLTTGVSAPPASSTPLTVACRRSGSRCTANVSIAGGASNRPVTVDLPSPGMRLVSTVAHPSDSQGAYDISHARYTGSGYRFVLSAVQANPPGSHLTLTFAPSAGHGAISRKG